MSQPPVRRGLPRDSGPVMAGPESRESAAGADVRVIRIGRPHRRNAIDSATAERLHDELVAFDADDSARVAVLTGDEQAFCAGADLVDLPRLRPSGPLGPTRLQLTKPAIAAVEGWCVAGGVELAAWCDLRVAGDGARFGCLERRWGVPLIDGGTYRLPRIVGLGRALDLILTGREFDAAEALDLGFVNRVVPGGTALDAAIELAASIAASPWTCVVHDRASVYEGLGLGLEEGLANEDRHGRAVIFDPGFAEGVARFTESQSRRRDGGDR
ncbi:MAG: crotonase/enoyl-CoA hydratase family protein [Acidimicrobiales bacterium]